MAPTNKNSNKKETTTKATGNGDRKPAASKGSPSTAFFWDFFVPNGAPANLSKTINPGIGLVNSAPLRTHSLTFDNKDEHDHIMQLTTRSMPVVEGKTSFSSLF